ncbi:hypothetical protein DN730_06330 [Marinomonas piezotolerans]|uniref:Uncharacterized protein n=1 Tax=Marinomonas piezotolerans TaxID=2213058 RepID=A0A370UBP4_9GAMM|nr:hypothetical protein [Marinomonas piezotolerans]RDL45223.1 hypothetical protein DN730_06330 [Marinomonas piezotolerans]
MSGRIQKLFAKALSCLFFLLAAMVGITSITSAVSSYMDGEALTQVLIQVINSNIIAIAVFELAMVINKEYGNEDEHDVIVMLRRTLPRFISTVCVALSLEGLIMVIKYSQMDMAGNLYYPVAIVISAALLLCALGVFLRFVPRET